MHLPNDSSVSWATGGSLLDNVLADMLPKIPSYWSGYADVNPLWHGIFGVILGVLTLITLIGNAVVIYIFSSTKSLRTPANLLIINLAFSDFFMLFTFSPPTILNSYYRTWILGSFMCELYGMLGYLFASVSIWTMTLIAFDRYNVVVRSLEKTPMTSKTAVASVIGIWAFAFMWTLLPMFGWNRYVPEGIMTVCGLDYLSQDPLSKSFIVTYSFFFFCAPLLLISFFAFNIIKAGRKIPPEDSKEVHAGVVGPTSISNMMAEYKFAKVILMTIIIWYFNWAPYLAINYIGLFRLAPLNPLATTWASISSKATAINNPIIYVMNYPKYRDALYKKFPGLICAPSGSEDTSSVPSASTNISEEQV